MITDNIYIKFYRLKIFSLFALIIISFSCEEKRPELGLKSGTWRGEIIAQGNSIPFNFEVNKADGAYEILLINGKEKLKIDRIDIFGDSLFFDMHIFDISIKAKIDQEKLSGSYSKNYAEGYVLPFKAVYGKEGRFDNKKVSNEFDGTWETTFKDVKGKTTSAIGIFKSDSTGLNGTFLSKTGDYRFLDGYVEKDTMHLYSFDGNHIYKFKVHKENDSILKGEFWSGKTSYKNFVSVRNDGARLPDANSLTYLKEGYDEIDFSFPDLDGNLISLKDEKFEDKVVILQILGTWCPNCMDETRFLSDWYRKNNSEEVEILGLAYEIRPDFDYARERVVTMKEKMNVPYDFVIAGTSSTKSASESLPMLNKVISFPTSIIIDKNGKVRRIHTGFSGPATGIYYEEFVDDFNQFMNSLLNE
ncbi:TlpA family protein disulfide reductase [Lutimonas saemankumensis]|uniref:peroxiredoxin family protein n=1 Tax=Lutimonas saemankumensis TaxID=483016 RepID=UPI001CD63C77|nr:TlpA disulfide reductase family protein [Lutimonas saemankumensis]MCA0932818.1 TlpA family protein disulfide reductase [Lutimonas saemankumensis]